LSIQEAKELYRFGNGEKMSVDASKLTVFVPYDEEHARVVGIDYAVHGQVTLDKNGSIEPGMFNFETHRVKSATDFFRNVGNVLGRAYYGRDLDGAGTPFLIEYEGKPQIEYGLPPPELPRFSSH
jgi:hypothetical protein